jgi:hypothetical protein
MQRWRDGEWRDGETAEEDYFFSRLLVFPRGDWAVDFTNRAVRPLYILHSTNGRGGLCLLGLRAQVIEREWVRGRLLRSGFPVRAVWHGACITPAQRVKDPEITGNL